MTTDRIEFYKTTDDYGCFSNFSSHLVFVDYLFWPTSEHYFQAQKFTSSNIKEQIRSTDSPMKAAKLGRSRDFPLRADWEDVKDKIMMDVVRLKVLQHSDVRETLLGTGNATIVEHTTNDSYWGDGGDGSGKNALGRIFMSIRSELTKDGPYDELRNALQPPWTAYPGYDRYSMGWRMGSGEDYWVEFGVFFAGLSDVGRKEYEVRFPEVEGWRGFYTEI